MEKYKENATGLNQYADLNREIERYRSAARYIDECFCPKNERYSCIRNCPECKYARDVFSIERIVEERITISHSNIAMGKISDTNPSNSTERRAMLNMAVEEITKYITDNYGNKMMDVFERLGCDIK